ncbi:MAG: hypothetical protein B6244_11400 [Candidatus Cloacimonetes bacterium 4572_55]|nr:MAG: hypothetical protein B6244_11400 [Candidatus Cloacimonetes bacterium 4572_55]
MSYELFLQTAIESTYLAGGCIKKMTGKIRNIRYKGAIDLVTEADLNSEKILLDHLRNRFPDHNFLTEEKGKLEGNSEYRWIIDPLDGTTNFAHNFPAYCVSIGLQYKGETIIGVVNDVSRNELFYAEKGQGASLNNNRIYVSQVENLNISLLATGFPYDIRTNPNNNMEEFQNFLLKAQAIRRPGSAAIDLCHVACGRFDGFWEPRLHPWDIAAGDLIVREAGGQVTDYRGGSLDLFGDQILASNSKIHQEMIDTLNKTAGSAEAL